MDPEQAITALQTLAALVGCLFIWNLLWPQHVVDNLRQNLFSIRHRLFMVALREEGGLTFQTPAYLSARASINALINAAGSLNIWMLLAMLLNDVRIAKFKRGAAVISTTKVGTPEQRAALAPTEKAVRIEVMKYFYLRTPFSSTILAAICILCAGIVFLYRYLCSVYARRGLSRFNPSAAIIAHVQRGFAQQMEVVLRYVSGFDKVAPWSRKSTTIEQELMYSDR